MLADLLQPMGSGRKKLRVSKVNFRVRQASRQTFIASIQSERAVSSPRPTGENPLNLVENRRYNNVHCGQEPVSRDGPEFCEAR